MKHLIPLLAIMFVTSFVSSASASESFFANRGFGVFSLGELNLNKPEMVSFDTEAVKYELANLSIKHSTLEPYSMSFAEFKVSMPDLTEPEPLAPVLTPDSFNSDSFQVATLILSKPPVYELPEHEPTIDAPYADLDDDIYEEIVLETYAISSIEPQAGQEYEIEENTISVEGVLTPEKTTVISSSRDGKIKKIHFDNGDVFSKGDILIEYDCSDLAAEMAAIEAENNLSRKKDARGEQLFKLDIISKFERMDLKNEVSKTTAQKAILQTRMENCNIRAAYDGRVVNRLANDNEYTRTDRVLMEVGSLDNLQTDFLVPSKWLRWLNIGAPVTLKLFETDREYVGHVSRIHGEVDPVSQSIQMTASLDPYDDPLLPGMSGEILIDISKIRDEGVQGYLERPAR